MALSRFERKERLGHGGVSEIAKKSEVAISVVSEVLNGKRRNRKVEVAIARKIGVKVTEAFPEHYQQPTQSAGA